MARTTVKKDEGSAGKAGGGDKPPRKPNPGVKGNTPKGPAPSEDTSATERAKNSWEEFQKYLKNVQAEAKRVSWPSKEQLKAYTMVVLATLLIVTVYLFLCDVLFTKLFAWLISMMHGTPKS